MNFLTGLFIFILGMSLGFYLLNRGMEEFILKAEDKTPIEILFWMFTGAFGFCLMP